MKNGIHYFLAIALCAIIVAFSSCNKEQSDTPKGTIKFSLAMGNQLKSGSLADSSGYQDSTTSYVALVTIQDIAGNEVYSSKKVEIFQFGGSYVSESLTLEAGDYKLTGFIILKGNKAVYAAPVQDSKRAQLVNQPLPLTFNIEGERATLVEPQVLTAENVDPVAFGYSHFGFEVIKTSWLNVIAYDSSYADSAFTTSADLRIFLTNRPDSLHGDTTYYDCSTKTLDYALKQGINKVEVNQVSNYYLSVAKTGYQVWSRALTLSEFENYKSNPLRIYLNRIIPNDTIISPVDSVLYTARGK